jgi:hypothetical protein
MIHLRAPGDKSAKQRFPHMWKFMWKTARPSVGLFPLNFGLVRCGKSRRKISPATHSPQHPKKFRFRAIASGDENRNEAGF